MTTTHDEDDDDRPGKKFKRPPNQSQQNLGVPTTTTAASPGRVFQSEGGADDGEDGAGGSDEGGEAAVRPRKRRAAGGRQPGHDVGGDAAEGGAQNFDHEAHGGVVGHGGAHGDERQGGHVDREPLLRGGLLLLGRRKRRERGVHGSFEAGEHEGKAGENGDAGAEARDGAAERVERDVVQDVGHREFAERSPPAQHGGAEHQRRREQAAERDFRVARGRRLVQFVVVHHGVVVAEERHAQRIRQHRRPRSPAKHTSRRWRRRRRRRRRREQRGKPRFRNDDGRGHVLLKKQQSLFDDEAGGVEDAGEPRDRRVLERGDVVQ